MMGDAHVTNAALPFPGLEQRHDDPRVHERVALHEVDGVTPGAQFRLFETGQGVALVAGVFAGRPDLVRHEQV